MLVWGSFPRRLFTVFRCSSAPEHFSCITIFCVGVADKNVKEVQTACERDCRWPEIYTPVAFEPSSRGKWTSKPMQIFQSGGLHSTMEPLSWILTFPSKALGCAIWGMCSGALFFFSGSLDKITLGNSKHSLDDSEMRQGWMTVNGWVQMHLWHQWVTNLSRKQSLSRADWGKKERKKKKIV